MQKIPLAQKGSAFGIRQITSHLLHPLLRRVPGDAGQRHSPCFQLDDKQNVVRCQTSPGEHLGGKEVHACQHRHVGGDEVLPCSRLAPFRSRRDPMPAQNVPDRLVRDLVAEVGKCTGDISYVELA